MPLPPLTLNDGGRLPRLGYPIEWVSSHAALSSAFVELSAAPAALPSRASFVTLLVDLHHDVEVRVRVAMAACACMVDLLLIRTDSQWGAAELNARWKTAASLQAQRLVRHLGVADTTVGQVAQLLNSKSKQCRA